MQNLRCLRDIFFKSHVWHNLTHTPQSPGLRMVQPLLIHPSLWVIPHPWCHFSSLPNPKENMLGSILVWLQILLDKSLNPPGLKLKVSACYVLFVSCTSYNVPPFYLITFHPLAFSFCLNYWPTNMQHFMSFHLPIDPPLFMPSSSL